ncbi:class I SAM-dependent methyltransferase [Streptomonospora sp. PA3]|uniref:class I SAM-dependent methyltransferase n=1 Tax=Streptomonospora sp. PA3 TaxID=2607326 RepID=UPI0012DCD055|nr:class I SAM-dependent methyltransferase [Streptomonospora sp. PA3]MUL41464.1 class I SAM-dependent methyltransferase [Streptomonospora sp. PA3]
MEIDDCRICGNRTLIPLLDLGPQAVTSIFPASRSEALEIPKVPLELVKCSPDGCGLVQLRHTADFSLMYGDHYGYRSGIRNFMIQHLAGKVADATKRVDLEAGDVVVDIGSNDGTLLHAYPEIGLTRVGIDPSGGKFRESYPADADLIADFFDQKLFTDRYGDRKAKIVTSFGMFYDLPRPMTFMQDVYDILDDDGIWAMEQSYMPAMLDADAYDVMCHEHLEYYALQQIEWMAERVGLGVISAEITSIYGGSLYVTLAKRPERHDIDEQGIERIRAAEKAAMLHTMAPYEEFAKRVPESRDRLIDYLADSRRSGRRTVGYGASTKGNVILQYCGLGEDELTVIGEPNEEKHGCFTPGTGIPIVSEEAAKALNPDQLLVLPWIYREGFIEREHSFTQAGGKLVFPLPRLDVV